MSVSYAPFSGKYSGLAREFQVNPDSCGNHSHYEEYIKYCAVTDYMTGKGRTYIILNEDPQEIIGFVTLRASSLVDVGGKPISGRSAVEITELAVSANYEKQGYGKMLTDLALTIVDTMRTEYLGIEYITLCSDPQSVPFYSHIGFSKIADYYEIPREGWNENCIPMAMKLPELGL
jgi:ribosomal protein S18 acetylase RimI-like enzyme